MHLVARQATASDFNSMVSLCHGTLDSTARSLEIWETIWQFGHTFGVVLADMSARNRRDLAIVVGTYVSAPALKLMSQAKKPGSHRILTDMVAAGERPFTTPQQIAELNATDGLAMMLPYYGWHTQTGDKDYGPSLRAIVGNAFMDRHAGNRLRSIYCEPYGEAAVDLATRWGFQVINGYNDVPAEPSRKPALMAIGREDGLHRENPWLGRFFTYFPPRFYFTDHQRQILLLARDGYTDNEIAALLGARAEAIKKRWASIYDRVNEVFPSLLPTIGENGRGAEKRRALLVHLRERPEELRPYARRAA